MTINRLDRLMNALNFAAADLEANRKGKMTERQREQVDRRRKAYLRKGDRTMVLVLAGFGIVVAVGWLIISRQDRSSEDLTALGAWVLGIFAVLIVLWVFARFRARGTWEWLASVDGAAHISIREYKPHQSQPFTLYDLHIGDHQFRLEGNQEMRGFDEGRAYRVYYAVAPVAVLLSAEPLED